MEAQAADKTLDKAVEQLDDAIEYMRREYDKKYGGMQFQSKERIEFVDCIRKLLSARKAIAGESYDVRRN